MRVIRLLLFGLVLVGWSLWLMLQVMKRLSRCLAMCLIGSVKRRKVPAWTWRAQKWSPPPATISAAKGKALMSSWAYCREPWPPGMNMETEEAVMNTTTIDGFRVHQSHEKAQKSGAIIVRLGGDDKSSEYIAWIMPA